MLFVDGLSVSSSDHHELSPSIFFEISDRSEYEFFRRELSNFAGVEEENGSCGEHDLDFSLIVFSLFFGCFLALQFTELFNFSLSTIVSFVGIGVARSK